MGQVASCKALGNGHGINCFIVSVLSLMGVLCYIGVGSAQSEGSAEERRKTLEILRNGDAAAQRRVLSNWQGMQRVGYDDELLAALLAVTKDSQDSTLRGLAFEHIGVNWISGAKEQPGDAIAAAIRLADDPNHETRHRAVYFGLSVVRKKTDEVIKAMLRAATAQDDYEWNTCNRIAWGLNREDPKRLQELFARYLNKTGPERNQALIAYTIYVQATDEEPPQPERFADESFLLQFHALRPAMPKPDELLAEFKKIVPQENITAVTTYEGPGVTFGWTIVKGVAARNSTMKALRNSGTLGVRKEFMPAIPKTVARYRQFTKLQEESAVKENAKERVRNRTRVISFPVAFEALHKKIGEMYPGFELKQIDWKQVGEELIPEAEKAKTPEECGLLVMRLVARLKDSHAVVEKGDVALPRLPFPQFDPGMACLIDDRGRPVVFYLDEGGPAEIAGVKLGMTVVSVDDKPAAEAMEEWMNLVNTYVGYSSERHLRHDAARLFLRQMDRNAILTLVMEDVAGKKHTFTVRASMGMRYIPRLPVPIDGIPDALNVSWKNLGDGIGYIRVRRIRRGLEAALDSALREMGNIKGLIIDVRGNTGGGFDSRRAFVNFGADAEGESVRPRFDGPIALLIDGRCISAGEGWASWFIANKRAKVFGTSTAGASSRKDKYEMLNGMYHVTIPVKLYRGFLDRLIEQRGLEPDVEVRNKAEDIARGQDTVLEAARAYLLDR